MLTAASYRGLPASVTLENYCPTPGDQGQYSTCVAFATAYHLRTILYVKAMRAANYSADPNAHLFSPTWVYEQIKLKNDYNCQQGASPSDAFDVLKYYGAATLRTQPYSCGSVLKQEARQESSSFKILSYETLYGLYETDSDYKVRVTKKALAEGNPCMLAFIVAKSFYEVKGDVWMEQKTDDGPTGMHGRHAMCIVGYDDNKYGGSFRVLNSWGTAWADKGYVWIPYKDFAKYSMTVMTAQAEKIKPKPEPNPVIITPELKGGLLFQQNNGEIMNTEFVTSLGSGTYDFSFYRMKETYSSGTRFRFYMNANTDAYVYAFATDNTGKINQVFPFASDISPLLFKNSTVAFPSEDKVIRMDDNAGKDYLLILYSKKPLAVSELISKMNSNYGNLLERAGKAIGSEIVRRSDLRYTENKIEFTLQQSSNGSVVPVLVEIPHK
ncbi:MAG: C1 family peptidase [Bacteroidota bacterium]